MSARIRAIREALHLSQREFGEGLGVSRDVISNIEYGRVQPKKLFLQHMCQLYNVNEYWLQTGKGDMFDKSANINIHGKYGEALDIFNTLRPEFQDYALQQIRNLVKLQESISEN